MYAVRLAVLAWICALHGTYAARTAAEHVTRAQKDSFELELERNFSSPGASANATGPEQEGKKSKTEDETAKLDASDADPVETAGTVLVLNASDMSRMKLEQGPGGGTVISTVISTANNSAGLGKFHSGQLVRLGGHYVRYSHPSVVRSVWARALNETGGHGITAMLMEGEVDSVEDLMILVGVIPALASLYVAVIALPWFIGEVIVFGRILSDAKPPTWPETNKPWEQENIMTKFEQVEQKLGITTQPPYKLQPFHSQWQPPKHLHFLNMIGNQYLWGVVILFQAAYLGKVFVFNIQFLLVDPTSVSVSFAVAFLGLVEAISVSCGVKWAQTNDLASAGKEFHCPVPKDVELKQRLEQQMLSCMVPCFVSMCLLFPIGFFKAHALFLIVVGSTPGFMPLVSNMVWDLNRALVKMAMLGLMLHVCLLARIAKTHVEALKQEVVTVYVKQKEATADTTSSHGQFNKERMELVHAYVVKVAVLILPRLPSVGMAAVVSVACSLVRTLLVILTFLTSERSVSELWYVIARMIIEFSGAMCLLPLTEVSNACDDLQPELNKLRAVSKPDDDKHIRRTEAYIKKANEGQGLGFVLYGVGMVVNRRILVSVGVKIVTFSSIGLTLAKRYIEDQKHYMAEYKTS